MGKLNVGEFAHSPNTKKVSYSRRVVTEVFRAAVWRYRAGGGRLYRLAYDHGLSPSALSAFLTGAKRRAHDERLMAIARTLGVPEDEVFESSSDQAAAS